MSRNMLTPSLIIVPGHGKTVCHLVLEVHRSVNLWITTNGLVVPDPHAAPSPSDTPGNWSLSWRHEIINV